MIALEKLFSSKTRVKLLTHFLSSPEEEFFVRELTRALKEQINSIRRELSNLEAVGLLKSRVEKRKRYYRVNPEYVLFDELTNIVKKATSRHGMIAVDVNKIGNVDLLLLTGIFTNARNAPVDILAIGKINKDTFDQYVKKLEKQISHELRYSVMTKEDYLFRKNCQDRFVKDILDSNYSIPINRLKIQLQ